MRAWTAATTLLLLVGPVACGGGDSVDDPDAGLSGCDDLLDEELLSRLRLSMEPTLAMQPGDERTVQLGVVDCCYFFEPVAACATWSVSPDEHASIDPVTGQLSVDEAAQHGDVFTVTADVEGGRALVSIDVHVYTDEANPLFGFWREAALVDCESGGELPYSDLIQELAFRADGTFQVTWTPFEVYVDYWGNYTYDLDGYTISLQVTGGNYVPDDVGTEGTFLLDRGGGLRFDDLWLGTASGSTADPACGHVFAR
jgi:hypothetical protein